MFLVSFAFPPIYTALFQPPPKLVKVICIYGYSGILFLSLLQNFSCAIVHNAILSQDRLVYKLLPSDFPRLNFLLLPFQFCVLERLLDLEHFGVDCRGRNEEIRMRNVEDLRKKLWTFPNTKKGTKKAFRISNPSTIHCLQCHTTHPIAGFFKNLFQLSVRTSVKTESD